MEEANKFLLEEKLRRIELVVMDVDGTLTDGAMYYSAEGEAMKRFSTRDGMGITLLHRAGIRTAIITSEDSPIVIARAAKLMIGSVIIGSRNKKQSLLELVEKVGTILERVAYIGDDVNDAVPMNMCGGSACPADAVEIIRSTAQFISRHNGGNGAVREFAEAILKAQNKPITLPEQW